MAITADGKIAKSDQELINWTSPEDKKYFVEQTKQAGVLIMGEKTFATIKKPLKNRLNIILTFEPEKKQNIPDILEFTNKPPKEILENLKKRNFNTCVIAGGATINTLFLKENLIDEIHLTIEPIIFGQGLNLFTENFTQKLTLMSAEKINQNSLLLKYQVIK